MSFTTRTYTATALVLTCDAPGCPVVVDGRTHDDGRVRACPLLDSNDLLEAGEARGWTLVDGGRLAFCPDPMHVPQHDLPIGA